MSEREIYRREVAAYGVEPWLSESRDRPLAGLYPTDKCNDWSIYTAFSADVFTYFVPFSVLQNTNGTKPGLSGVAATFRPSHLAEKVGQPAAPFTNFAALAQLPFRLLPKTVYRKSRKGNDADGTSEARRTARRHLDKRTKLRWPASFIYVQSVNFELEYSYSFVALKGVFEI